MATLKSTTKAKRPAARRSVKACEALPAYGLPDGALSFRRGLKARERGTIDRALEIIGRMMRVSEIFATVDAVKSYMQLRLAGEACEHFGALYLNSQHHAIAFEIHFVGTLNEASVYPREIVRAALHHHAAAVVLTHNHPGGNVNPSRADKALTETLKAALSLVGVRVVDHIIVAPGEAFSMAERGLI